MTQFTQLRDLCDDFGLETELAVAPRDDDEKEFELIVDFASGQVDPESAIEAVEDDFDISIYDAAASRNEPTIAGQYVLALSS